jgi:hypothetical protein
MSHKPLLPSGLQRGLPFLIPDDWTPQQALAIFEILDDLLAVVTDAYGDQLNEILRQRRSTGKTAFAAAADDDPI